MATYVALLRSVNVAGHGRLAMAELKEMFVGMGFAKVSTYIQTGNVIFGSASRSPRKLESMIESRLELTFGAAPKVIIRTAEEFAEILATSPFAKSGADPARHHVTFLATAPPKQRLAEFEAPESNRDELAIIGREIYVHTPDGYANTKLTGTYLERHLGVSSTTRNWNSVTKLGVLVAAAAS